jgi:hypothetical protein
LKSRRSLIDLQACNAYQMSKPALFRAAGSEMLIGSCDDYTSVAPLQGSATSGGGAGATLHGVVFEILDCDQLNVP